MGAHRRSRRENIQRRLSIARVSGDTLTHAGMRRGCPPLHMLSFAESPQSITAPVSLSPEPRVIRNVSPDLRTLPSSTFATLSRQRRVCLPDPHGRSGLGSTDR